MNLPLIIFGAVVVGIALASKQQETNQPVVQEIVALGQEEYLPYDEFHNFPTPESCLTLTKLNLTYVELDPNDLIKSLNGCNMLEILWLENVEWNRPIAVDKVLLPAMKKFHLTMYEIEASSANEFMAHVFFNKDSTVQNYMLAGVDIEMKSKNDGKWLHYSQESETVVLDLNYFNFDVSIYFHHTRLILAWSVVVPKSLQMNNLTALSVFNESFPAELLEVLESAHSLTTLELVRFLDTTSQPLSFDLALLPGIETFQNLTFTGVDVWSSKFIELKSISSFYLEGGILNATLISMTSVSTLDLENTVLFGTTLNMLVSNMKLHELKLDYRKFPNSEFDLQNLAGSGGTLNRFHFKGLLLEFSSMVGTVLSRSSHGKFTECGFNESSFMNRFKETFLNLKSLEISQSNISYALLQDMLSITSLSTVEVFRMKDEISEIDKFLWDSGVPKNAAGAVLRRSKESITGWTQFSFQYLDRRLNTQLRDFILRTYVIGLVVIIGFGILGNVLSAVVLTRKNMWSSTSCILLGLAFCDTLVLVTYSVSLLYFGIKLILVFLKFSLDSDYAILGYALNESSVKWLDELQYRFMYPLNKTGYTGSVYATTLLTLERYVAVCWPFHSRRLLRTKMAIHMILLVMGFAAVLNFSRWIEAKQSTSSVYVGIYTDLGDTRRMKGIFFDRNTQCSGLLRYRYYRRYYHGWTWITLMYCLPISAIIILNFKILQQLRISKRSRSLMAFAQRTNRDTENTEDEDEQLASLTKMLLCVILIFVLCNSACGIIIWILTLSGGWDPADTEIFSCIPLIINSSVNFVIYTLLGSKFRTELRRLICVWKRMICRIGRRNRGVRDINSQPNAFP